MLRELSRLPAQNFFHFLLLIAAQRGTKYAASVAAELLRHFVGIGSAQKPIDGGVTRLNHRPDLLDKLIGDAEFVLPPCGVDSARSRAKRGSAGGSRSKSPCRYGAGPTRDRSSSDERESN